MKTLLQPEQQKVTVSFYSRRPSYNEAQQIVKGKVFSMTDYKRFQENHSEYQLPANPDVVYKKDWISAYAFLGTQPRSKSEHMKLYWQDVKSGVRTRATKYKKAPKPVKLEVEAPIAVKAPAMSALEEKQLMISLFKKYGIYEQCKPAFRSLFTIDELLDLANL
jgi:hypothetical protein